ncbi:MAG: mechanosensitive ion channel family protein [Gemmatimonadaceae bacterium]
MRHVVLVTIVASALMSPSAMLAQRLAPADSQGSTKDTAAAVAGDTAALGAPVVFQMDTLFRLYGSLGPFAARARAAAVNQRLRQLPPEIAAGDSIVVTDRQNYSELAVRGVVLMTVVDADAIPSGIGRAALARRYSTQIRKTLADAVNRMSGRALLMDAAYAVVATAVLVLLLQLLSLAYPKLYSRIDTLGRVRLASIRIQNFELLSAGRLSLLLTGLARLLRLILTLLLFYIYVPLVLSFFPWTASLSHRIIGYALLPFAAAWFAFIQYLPKLFYLAGGIIIVRYLLAFVHLLFGAVGTGAIKVRGFYADWSEPTYKIVRVLILVLAGTVLYPYLPGASTDAFKGVSIFVGVLFSLGSSSAIGNMVAGIVLTYTRAFHIGDRVQIAETVGDVIEKTLLVTRLRTIKHVAVTIPNGTVLASHVVNFTTLAESEGLILHTTVTIGYDAPWQRVESLLVEAATRTADILTTPPPFVLQTSLDDFFVHYQLNATTNRAEKMAGIYSQLHRNIQDTFNEAGVEIMSPHYNALRDGNHITIPEGERPADYRPGAFRFTAVSSDGAPSDSAAGTVPPRAGQRPDRAVPPR